MANRWPSFAFASAERASVPNGTGAVPRVTTTRKRKHPLPGGWNVEAIKLLLAIPYKGHRMADMVQRDLWWVRLALWHGETLRDIEAAFRGVQAIWPNLKRERWNPCRVFSKRGTTPGYTLFVRAKEAHLKQAGAGTMAQRINDAIFGRTP